MKFKGIDIDVDNIAVTAEDVEGIVSHVSEAVTNLLARHAVDVMTGEREADEGSLIVETATLTTGAGKHEGRRPYLLVFSQGVGSELYAWIFQAVQEEVTKNPQRVFEFLKPHFEKLTKEEVEELFEFHHLYEKAQAEAEEAEVSASDRIVMADYLKLVEDPEDEGEDGAPFTPPTKPTIN